VEFFTINNSRGESLGKLLLSLAYFVLVVGIATGFAKLVLRDNQVLKILHRSCGTLVNFLYSLYFILFQFQDSVPTQRIALTVAFIFLVYAGFVSAKPDFSINGKAAHITGGVMSLIILSFIFFTFVLMHLLPFGAG
jgi:hypothetical protein